ncbi:MAG TPA: polysaccharide deacetylase family protein [Pyrinomonadaceae bacterium]|nr:polysaccharide deacetylase family protein [Pyrinomonadaceae bacterium]
MKKIISLGIAVLLILVSGVVLWQISRSRTFQFFGRLVARVETSQKVVALTFDDGPTPDATSRILATLEQEHVRATFFVIGGELEQHLNEGKKIVTAGHELGNHTYSHERMVLVTPSL